MNIKQERKILKLSNGPINKMINHPFKQNCVLMTGAEGKISCFSLEPFELKESHKIFYAYSTCILALGEKLFVGSSTGELVSMKCSGEVLKRIQISNECLSSLVSCDQYLIVTSFDGIVRFLNKTDLSVEKEIDVEVPIWDSEYFENKIFLAGNISFTINVSTFETKKLQSLNSFTIHNSKIYACSYEKGLTCLTTNSNSYIPCSFMLSLKDRLMTFSEESVNEIKDGSQMEWKCHRIKEIKKGVSITSACSIGNIIVLGDNEGKVYRLEYEMIEKSKYEASVGTDDEDEE